jgi:hypothetical protein
MEDENSYYEEYLTKNKLKIESKEIFIELLKIQTVFRID